MTSIFNLSEIPNSDFIRPSSSSDRPDDQTKPVDILSFLALSQARNIDILPITWFEELEVVGRGGTAEIREALVSLQMSLAFKRLHLQTSGQDDEKSGRNHAATAEIVVLSHPWTRKHPCIINLIGVCWDIDWELSMTAFRVWPVFVFEKSQFGDLETFMSTWEGLSLGMEARIDICSGIASAVMTLHSAGFVHGDIKPGNALIFMAANGTYIPKIIDFGYSPGPGLGQDEVILPYSYHWTHPEYHKYYTIDEAKEMDAYSFGMVCLWLLFYSGKDVGIRSLISQLEKKSAISIAEDSISNSDYGDKKQLYAIFHGTLQRPCASFRNLYDLLNRHNGKRTVGSNIEDSIVDEGALPLLQQQAGITIEDFKITTIMCSLCRAPWEVRAHIVARLEQRVNNSPVVGLELALCYKIGFGTPKNDEMAASLLITSKKTESDLLTRIEDVKQLRSKKFGKEFGNLVNEGQIRAIDLSQHYRGLKRLKEAESIYRREITDLESVLGRESGIILILKSELSAILSNQGRWEEAETLEREVLDAKNQIHRGDCFSITNSMASLAVLHRNRGSWNEAEGLEREILELTEKGNQSQLRISSAKANLATTLIHQGHWASAEELLLSVIETRSQVFGEEHPIMTTSLANLAAVFLHQGRWAEAELEFSKVVSLNKRILGDAHPDTIKARNNLASAYWNQGRFTEAEKEFQLVTSANESILGAEHPNTLQSQGNLAASWRNLGRLKEAENLERKVMELRERLFGENDTNTLLAKTNLATTLIALGRWDEAEQLQVPTAGKCEDILGLRHHTTLEAQGNLVSIFLKKSRYREAAIHSSKILEIQKDTLGSRHPRTIQSSSDFAVALMNTKRLTEAEKILTETMETGLEVLGQGDHRTLTILANLGLVYRRQGKLEEAEGTLSSVVHMRTFSIGESHSDTLSSMTNLAAVQLALGKLEDAEKNSRRAWEIHSTTYAKDHPSSLVCASNLGAVLLKSNRLEEAEMLFKEVIEIKKQVFGPNHASTINSMNFLLAVYDKQSGCGPMGV